MVVRNGSGPGESMIKRKSKDRDFIRKQQEIIVGIHKKYGRREVLKEKMRCPRCKDSYIEFSVHEDGSSSGWCLTSDCFWWANV